MYSRAAVTVLATVIVYFGGVMVREGAAKEPPRVSPSYPRRHNVNPGDAVRLVCPVDPTPSAPPIVTWQREKELIHAGWERYRIQDDGRVLKITNVEIEDTGTFVCRAANGFGSVDIKHYLYVYGSNKTESTTEADGVQDDSPDNNNRGAPANSWKAQVEIVPPYPANVTVPVGGEAVFVCHAQGDGEPRIQWLKTIDEAWATEGDEGEQPRPRVNGSQAGLGGYHRQRYTIVDGSITIPLRGGTYLNKLSLHNVREKDSGLYICSTMNGRGFGYKSAHLNVVPGVVHSSNDRYNDDHTVPESTFVPVVIATVTVIGIVFVLVTLIIICQRHFLRKSTSSSCSHSSAGFPLQKYENPKSSTTDHSRFPSAEHSRSSVTDKSSSTVPLSAGPAIRHPQGLQYDSRSPYHLTMMVHHYGDVVPSNYIPTVVASDRRLKIPYRWEDTSSECSTLFKPTPAPAATPIPPTECDFPYQEGFANEPFLRRNC